MIEIDDKEYDEATLPEAARVNLARMMALRNEIMELSLVLEEKRIALQAREQEVVRLVKEHEEQSSEE
jgi:serine/threonine protein kinase HipA of HipAB toxin-antitoxin module